MGEQTVPHQRALLVPVLIVPPAHRPSPKKASRLVTRRQHNGTAYQRRPTMSLVPTAPGLYTAHRWSDKSNAHTAHTANLVRMLQLMSQARGKDVVPTS